MTYFFSLTKHDNAMPKNRITASIVNLLIAQGPVTLTKFHNFDVWHNILEGQ